MKVLQVIPGMSASGGAENSLAAVAPFLIAADVELHLAVLTEAQDLVPSMVLAGAAVHDLSGGGSVAVALRLWQLVRRLRPDLIHATLLQAALPAQLVGSLCGVPVLVSWANTAVDHTTEPVATWKLRFVRISERVAAVPSRSRFHAVTAGVKSSKCEELHVAPRRVRVAERGRDPERFQPFDPSVRGHVRASLGFDDGDVVFLSIGRQEPQKGYPDLIRAFDPVAVEVPAHLLIAGRSGAATPMIEGALEQIRMSDAVRLLGQRDDIADLLAASDVVACASYREGAAGALIEAMAVGVPILSVEVEGLAGVLEDGVNAKVVARDRLSEGMMDLARDPDRRANLARGARQTFEDRFTIEQSALALFDVYGWAIEDDAR